jgi:hypothetical protein
MEIAPERREDFIRLWDALVALVNYLPEDERQEMQTNLKEYIHELRHTIGLITSAQALLQRDLSTREDRADILMLLDIISIAANRLTNLVANNLQHVGEDIKLGDKQVHRE